MKISHVSQCHWYLNCHRASLNPPPPAEGASYRLIRWWFQPSLSIRCFQEEDRRQTAGARAAFDPANMVKTSDIVCLLVPLVMLARSSLQAPEEKSGKEAQKAGNFMEDEQWLSTISQYSRKIKHWNRFRDVSVD